MDRPSLVEMHDPDTGMLPMNAVVDQVAGSLRQLREQFEYDDGDIHMESAFEHQSNAYQSPQPIRLLIIDTNILIGHLNLIEWLGQLLLAARKLGKGSDYRCGLLIPRMVRLELDKHKMPHNKRRMVTALLEPPPISSSRSKQTSIHSTEGSRHSKESIQISLYEAADRAIKWMSHLFKSTPPDCSIVKFQTRTEVSDPKLTTSSGSTGTKVSPDMLILDCASYFKLQVEPQGGGVILLTNDKALSLEAELEGLSTLRIQPGLSPQSLLDSFDSTLAQQIDLLMTAVSFKGMLTADWYKIPPSSNTNLIPLTNNKYELSSNGNHSRYANDSTPKKDKKTSNESSNCTEQTLDAQENVEELSAAMPIEIDRYSNDYKSFPKKDKTLSNESSNFPDQTLNCQDNIDELSAAMPIEIDEEMQMMSDSEMIPIFPTLYYQYMLIPVPLPIPQLLHLHHHIEQAVGALLRPRLFDFLFRTSARNDLALLFQQVALVFDKRKMDSQITNGQDPHQWTAVDCLTLINELWNESTSELFGEETNQTLSELFREETNPPLSESTNRSISKPKSEAKKLLNSRWGPRSQYTADVQDAQTSLCSTRLGRTRKAVQVLIDQLKSYHGIHLPRDNPMSWSLLFWEGLIEDIHKVTYYGRFFLSLCDLENFDHPKDFLLQKVIQNWKSHARSLS